MQSRVVIRRQRPHAIAFAVAYLLTALAFYLVTLLATRFGAPADANTSRINEPRVSKKCVFEGGVYSFVYLGKYTDASLARINSARYTNQGAAGCVYASDGFYYSLGNAYAERAHADAAAKRVKEESGLDCAVIDLAAPTLTIMLTAGDKQIARVEDGYRALIKAEDDLRAIAEKLDAGLLSAASARSFAAIAAYELKSAVDALSAAVTDDSDQIIISLRARAEHALDEVSALAAGGEAEMYMSARVKHARIRLILARFEYLNAC